MDLENLTKDDVTKLLKNKGGVIFSSRDTDFGKIVKYVKETGKYMCTHCEWHDGWLYNSNWRWFSEEELDKAIDSWYSDICEFIACEGECDKGCKETLENYFGIEFDLSKDWEPLYTKMDELWNSNKFDLAKFGDIYAYKD